MAAAGKSAEEGMVVNVEHLMAYVEEQKSEGNAAFKAKRYSDALAAWQKCIDAIAQADGRPMDVEDMRLVLVVRSVLHSNRGQALMHMQFWRRALKDLDEAIAVDPENVKAIWRRCKAHEALKQWAEAEADAALLLSLQKSTQGRLLEQAGITAPKLEVARKLYATKREEADATAAETFEDRAEEAAATGLHKLRERFEEATKRNGLHGNAELATELADMVTRPGGVSAQHVANVYQIDDEDAETLLAWVRKACTMKDVLNGVV